MKKISINIVMTCHNRREKTKKCIQSILNQKDLYKYKLKFYICDDASTDNTEEAIYSLIPDAVVIKGNGSLFWAKGMSLALKYAEKEMCDFYLMINDDVEFFENMLETMFTTFNKVNSSRVAISGVLMDKISAEYTYGGEKIIRRGVIETTINVEPQKGKLLKCDRANWNCFLISRSFYNIVGRIDDYYEHSYADYDYSNRINNENGSIYISTDYVGWCSRNSIKNTWRDKSLPLFERLKKLHQPTGIPIKSSIHYWRKFDKKFWIIKVARPYLAIIKDGFVNKRGLK